MNMLGNAFLHNAVIGSRCSIRIMKISDIKDRVYWNNNENRWKKEDNPRATLNLVNPFNYYCKSIINIIFFRKKKEGIWRALEIESKEGCHIGFVTGYPILVAQEPIGYAISVAIPELKHRNKGFGTEAVSLYIRYLSELGIHTFYYYVHVKNTASIRLAEKLGFVKHEFNESKQEYTMVKGE